MDLSSRINGATHMIGEQALLDHNILPSHSSVLGSLHKSRMDGICIEDQNSPRELENFYSQSHVPLDPMKYRLPGHSTPPSLVNHPNSDISRFMGKYPDGPAYPQYSPDHLQNIHHHLSTFHSQMGPNPPDPSSSLNNDVGMHLTLLSSLPHPETTASSSHPMLSTISHSSLPPPPFPLSRPSDLFSLLHSPPPSNSPSSSLSSHLIPQAPPPSNVSPHATTNNMMQHHMCSGINLLGLNNGLNSQESLYNHQTSEQIPLLNENIESHRNALPPFPTSTSHHSPLHLLKEYSPINKQYPHMLEKSVNQDDLPAVNDSIVSNSEKVIDSVPSNDELSHSSNASIESDNEHIDLLDITDLSNQEKKQISQEENFKTSDNVEMSQSAEENAKTSTTDETCSQPEENENDESINVQETDETETFRFNRVVFCSVCRKGYGSQSALEKHMLVHGPHICNVCGKHFPRQCSLKLHMAVHAERNFFCEECGKSFKSLSALQTHKNTVHLTTESCTVVCDSCGVILKNRKSLLQHEQMHILGKRFACDLCDERFHRKDALNRHVVRIHVEERFFNCQVCGNRYNTNEALQDHLWVHESERPHECTCCKRRFPQRSALERHMRSHTGDRPFTCGICGTAFTRSYRLKYHMQRHYSDANNEQISDNSSKTTQLNSESECEDNLNKKTNYLSTE